MNSIYIVALNAVPFLPYVHGLLRACVEEDAELAQVYEFRDPIFLLESPGFVVDQMEEPAVVGLSCYVWNFRKHMKVARLVKERYPKALIVAGGPHIPDQIGDFFKQYPFVDVLVHGEGEYAFRAILRERLSSAPNWSRIPGTTFNDRSAPVRAQARPEGRGRWVEVHSAYQNGYLESSIRKCRERGLQFFALWETNRGCPYACSFCDWGSSTMSQVRKFSDTQLLADIEYFGHREVSNLFICDANFGMLPRDLEIAGHLVESRRRYGYPKQVRVNFAKNSNDRVFQISKLFAQHDMLMGTTLSMQSMELDVLEAVDRKNIGIDNYLVLNSRYATEHIHTYTELILGLPRETSASFKEGIGRLLEAGGHEDLRVFDFMMLPNAPANAPTTRKKYGLVTSSKRLYVESPATPEDEVETAEFVFQTNTMSRDAWIDCAIFAQIIQILHNGCFTRYVAIHLRRQYGIAYEDFYQRLIDFSRLNPSTVLGNVTSRFKTLYQSYTENPDVPHVHLVYSQPDMVNDLLPYGRRRGWTPDNWGWLSIASNHDQFFSELGEFLRSFELLPGTEIDDLLRYQSDIILQPDYDPVKGKTCCYRYDFPGYFSGGGELRAQPVIIRFRDTHMGVNYQYPIEAGNQRRFAKAAIGESYPFVRIHHYQHQLAKAEITYARPAEFVVTGGTSAVYT